MALLAAGRRKLSRWSRRACAPGTRRLTRDTVVAAHGGTARGLIAALGIAQPAAAPLIDIAQGVVYVFERRDV